MSAGVEGAALLPCPFCGGQASIYQNTKEDGTGDYDPGFYFVRCDPCDLIHDKAWCVPHAEAVTAWNTRATPQGRSYADGVEDAAKLALTHSGMLALAQGHEDAEGQADRWYEGGKHAAQFLSAAIATLPRGGRA